jgi:dihydroorotate dehydrogenase electron transfer subunit
VPANRDIPLLHREALEGAYVLLTFRHPEIAAEARPGQFVMIKAGLSSEPPLRRPFSIMAVDPSAHSFTLFLKAIGGGTRALCGLEPGELAQCLGPLGRPFSAPADAGEALMVAGGYGIAPFLMLSRELARAGRPGRVFYGGRTASDLQLRGPFDGIGIPLVPATEDGSLGHHGRVTESLEAYLDGRGGRPTLYACGPDAMLHAVARIAERRALACQVSLDPWMGCGVGTCLGCVVWTQKGDEARAKYRCACTEGPVFDSRLVVWRGEAESLARRQARGSAPEVPRP